jgi:hypothetical protein
MFIFMYRVHDHVIVYVRVHLHLQVHGCGHDVENKTLECRCRRKVRVWHRNFVLTTLDLHWRIFVIVISPIPLVTDYSVNVQPC